MRSVVKLIHLKLLLLRGCNLSSNGIETCAATVPLLLSKDPHPVLTTTKTPAEWQRFGPNGTESRWGCEESRQLGARPVLRNGIEFLERRREGVGKAPHRA